jgi:hypothetical protein
MSNKFDDIPEDEDGVDQAFDRYNEQIGIIQRNTVLNGAKELTEKSQVGFTREQLAEHIKFNINIVNFWVRTLIYSNDILVDTSGMLSVNSNIS